MPRCMATWCGNTLPSTSSCNWLALLSSLLQRATKRSSFVVAGNKSCSWEMARFVCCQRSVQSAACNMQHAAVALNKGLTLYPLSAYLPLPPLSFTVSLSLSVLLGQLNMKCIARCLSVRLDKEVMGGEMGWHQDKFIQFPLAFPAYPVFPFLCIFIHYNLNRR